MTGETTLPGSRELGLSEISDDVVQLLKIYAEVKDTPTEIVPVDSARADGYQTEYSIPCLKISIIAGVARVLSGLIHFS